MLDSFDRNKQYDSFESIEPIAVQATVPGRLLQWDGHSQNGTLWNGTGRPLECTRVVFNIITRLGLHGQVWFYCEDVPCCINLATILYYITLIEVPSKNKYIFFSPTETVRELRRLICFTHENVIGLATENKTV